MPTDYSNQLPEVRDQGNSGQCYAFVAADLIGFNQGVKPPQAVSALDVGIQFLLTPTSEMKGEVFKMNDIATFTKTSLREIPTLESHRKSLKNYFTAWQVKEGGGFSGLAIMAYQKRSGGICMEEQLSSEGSLVDTQRSQYIAQQTMKLAGTSKYSVMNGYGIGYGMGGGVGYYQKPLPTAPSEEPFISICNMHISNLEYFYPLIEKTNQAAAEEISKNINEKCGLRKPLKPMTFATFSSDRKPEAMTANSMMSLLKQGLPVGINYDSSFLQIGRTARKGQLTHASSIVGSRWNETDNTCEFKLRNSWGKDCKAYSAEFRENCDNHNTWITENDVNTRVGELFIVKPK